MAKTKAQTPRTAERSGGLLGTNHWDRRLGGAFFGIMLLSVICIIGSMILQATGVGAHIPQLLVVMFGVALVGPAIGIILLIVLVIRIAVRRSKENARA